MSDIGIECTVCDSVFYVRESLKGGLTNCPKCNELLQVPGQANEDLLFWIFVGAVGLVFFAIVGVFVLFTVLN
ncbi:MAG: hypothetical protein P1V97_25050 [Planctomycetota bacterium]|nr:hypothetical protein [Planctomycetota bacterium]